LPKQNPARWSAKEDDGQQNSVPQNEIAHQIAQYFAQLGLGSSQISVFAKQIPEASATGKTASFTPPRAKHRSAKQNRLPSNLLSKMLSKPP
jgi:hypothetical protein